ncbi:hypothetical protein [Aerosticca soli]|uniref:Uncharacterized protein n=1 Tax=Aerosticca soli TaxID=2010829 RepID=A0A2Z6E157_9GAMM|nr:hypothetical protein [Aerosticca soli]MDI3259197.1 hypothetical protein [Nevskiaceae bacterium]MDI3261027.1 hypothetical protein [Nevskiaceae bacterium]BBD78715.1 hypothetical protein ALSL_0036 [Aerosticca soli]
MNLFARHARVREAQARLRLARREVQEPVAALLVRGYTYPLTTLGVAAGVGFVAGCVGGGRAAPARAAAPLLRGGLFELLLQGARWFATTLEDDDTP